MGRAALGVRTRLGPQEDVTPAAPRQGTAKRVGHPRERPGVIGSDEGIHGPCGGDELHDRFLLVSQWLYGFLPGSIERTGVREDTPAEAPHQPTPGGHGSTPPGRLGIA